MALSSGRHLLGQRNLRHTMGADAVNSDATLVIFGYENMYIKIKSFPDPSSGVQSAIEVPTPLGTTYSKAGQRNPKFEGSASFIETEDRAVQAMFNEIIANGGYFDAWLYHGTPNYYVNRKHLRDCVFVQSSPTQRDFSSNTEVLTVEGDIHGLYFLEMEEGNAKTLMGGNQ